MKKLVLLLTVLSLTGCAGRVAELEQRIAELERRAGYDLTDVGAAGVGFSSWTQMVDNLATGDLMAITDSSDTTQSDDGTSKYITISQLISDTPEDGVTAEGISSNWAYDLLNTDTSATFSEDIYIDKVGDAENARILMYSDAGEFGGMNIKNSATEPRWSFGKADVAETGSDAGSQFFIGWFDDDENWMGTALQIWRDTGNVELDYDLVLNDQADHSCTPTSGKGCLWVRTSDGALIYTNGAGTDTALGSGGTWNGTYLDFTEQSSAPVSPASGHGAIWVYDSPISGPQKPYFTDENDVDYPILTNVADDPSPSLAANLDVGAYMVVSSTGDVIVRLPDNGGTYAFKVQDSDGVTVWEVDSNGTVGP